MDDQRLLFSRKEAAKILGIGETKYKELIGAGEIREIDVGARKLTPRSELEKFVARKQQREAASAA